MDLNLNNGNSLTELEVNDLVAVVGGRLSTSMGYTWGYIIGAFLSPLNGYWLDGIKNGTECQ
jgi:hypothetical protein